MGIVTATVLTACGVSSQGAREDVGSSRAAVSSCASGTVTKGVDVSHYQGTIDWSTVKSSGIAFGFVKATESTDYIDPDFATNWSSMKTAGVVRGAYHFFDPAVDATSQATYCLATVGTLESGDLPIVLDFEDLDGVSEATAVEGAVVFLAAVTKSTGKTAILYMSSDFLSGAYPALAAYTLWVANYGVTCPGMPSEWSRWTYWQDSATGTVSGITADVDLDDFNGPASLLGGGSSSSGSSGGSSSGASGGGSSSGSSSGSKGGTSSGSGGELDAGETGSSSGSSEPPGPLDASAPVFVEDAAAPTSAAQSSFGGAGSGSGCALAAAPRGGSPFRLALVALVGVLALRRRRAEPA